MAAIGTLKVHTMLLTINFRLALVSPISIPIQPLVNTQNKKSNEKENLKREKNIFIFEPKPILSLKKKKFVLRAAIFVPFIQCVDKVFLQLNNSNGQLVFSLVLLSP